MDHRIYVCICRELPGFFIILEHDAHVRLAESQHHVESVVGTDIPADIESAGQIVQCDWTYAGHKNAFEHALEFLEYLAIESAGMSQGMIYLVALLVEDNVGEVIIFIDDEIELGAIFSRMQVQIIQFTNKVWLRFHLLSITRIVIRFISFSEYVHHHTTITVEILS